MNPKVSIIIPVYNGENYMREAIDSALAQTYDNCEVLVVNDGSTDNTEMIARSYGDRIRYFAKENGGVSTALNVGIEHMEGEYFQYLPHDDVLHPDKIEKNISAIKQSGDEMSIVWSGWNYKYMDERGLKKSHLPFRYADDNKLANSVFPLLFGLVNTVTVLINKRYFERIGKFDTTLYTSQDYDMWFRTFIDRKNIYIKEELVDYRMHPQQGTQSDPEFIKNCISISNHMVANLSEDQIIAMFGNKYRFVCYMLDFYKRQNWMDCYKNMYEQFKNCAEPSEGERERDKLKRYLEKLGYRGNNLVLYCAGKNGRSLRKELEAREIRVRAFSDGDKSKTGTSIDGVMCIDPNDIDRKKDLVIVTKDEPESVISYLRSKGIERITSYEETGKVIYDTLPAREAYMFE